MCQSLQEKQLHVFILTAYYTLTAMKYQYVLGKKTIILMKISLKTCQLGMCCCACETQSNYESRQQYFSIKDLNRSKGQVNSLVQQDFETIGSFGVVSFPHQHSHDRSLNALKNWGTALCSLHKHRENLTCLLLGKEGQSICLLSQSAVKVLS